MHIVCVSFGVFIYYFNCISFAIRLSGRKVAIKLIDWFERRISRPVKGFACFRGDYVRERGQSAASAHLHRRAHQVCSNRTTGAGDFMALQWQPTHIRSVAHPDHTRRNRNYDTVDSYCCRRPTARRRGIESRELHGNTNSSHPQPSPKTKFFPSLLVHMSIHI